MVFRLFSLISMLVFPLLLVAQRFGGNPASFRWQQSGTDTVRVIFPTGTDSLAGRVAAITHRMAGSNPVSLGQQIKGIDILLQS
ncbi:MAG: hypothetical protein RL151_99, partial [Bacteroidota bacterium]